MPNQGHPSIFGEWPRFQSPTCDACGSPRACLERYPSHEIDTWTLLSQRIKPGVKLPDPSKLFAPFIVCSVVLVLEVVSLFRMFVSLLLRTSANQPSLHPRIRSIGALRSIVLAIVSTLWSLVWTLVSWWNKDELGDHSAGSTGMVPGVPSFWCRESLKK